LGGKSRRGKPEDPLTQIWVLLDAQKGRVYSRNEKKKREVGKNRGGDRQSVREPARPLMIQKAYAHGPRNGRKRYREEGTGDIRTKKGEEGCRGGAKALGDEKPGSHNSWRKRCQTRA